MDGKMGSPFQDVFPTPAVNPSVPINNNGGESLASPFVDGNTNTGGGGVMIPQGQNIAGPTPGPLASPFQEGALASKNK